MNRFQRTFDKCRQEGRVAIMPYMTAGDPDLATTRRLIDRLVEKGADMIELGMPYSDPLADGPTVQAAGQRSLAAGTNIDRLFDTVRDVRDRHPNVPIALLIYYNCIFRRGEARFAKEAAAAGLDGVIIPDLPPEEGNAWHERAQSAGLCPIHLAAPTSTPERLQLVAEKSDGFVYCVSVTGVTGARTEMASNVSDFLGRIREAGQRVGKSLPLALGFGLSTPDHVASIKDDADGAIVGSALINAVFEAPSIDEGIDRAGELIQKMREASFRNKSVV